MSESWEVAIEQLRGRVNELAAVLQTHTEAEEKAFNQNDKEHDEFKQKLDRPSWAVTVMFSVLSSITVGLTVFIATH